MVRRKRTPEEEDRPTFSENFSKALRTFVPSLALTLPYMLFGIVIGLVLLYAGIELEEKHYSYSGKFLEHLAAGFFVSALAVLFYEWGSHVKEAMELAARLEDFLADPDHYVEHGLKHVLVNTDKTFIDHQQAFLQAVVNLGANKGWYAGGLVAFLGRFIDVAAKNALNLEALGSDLLKHPGSVRSYSLDLSAPEAYADDMLTEQMNRLTEGDTYDTFSNPETWQAPLESFATAGFNAVERHGVTIRRMFIIEKYSPKDAVNLRRHFKASENERYKIQIVDADYSRDTLGFATRPHYGIFRHENSAIVFDVENPPSLQKFKLLAGRVDPEPPRDDLNRKVLQFEHAWQRAAPDCTFDVMNFTDWVLAREVDQLEKDARYDVVMTPESNAGLEHMRLTEALKRAITRGVTVRRIIVLGTPDDENHPVVDRYKEAANGQSYQLRHVMAPAAGDVKPFVVLWLDGIRRSHPVVFSESANLTDFIIEERATQHQTAFETLWQKAEPFRS